MEGQRYACQTRQRTVDTAKNRVLIELLSTFKQILNRFETELSPGDGSKLGWFEQWEEGSTARRILQDELNNVYLSQLTVGESKVDSRELTAVLQARDPLYREAAVLLQNYKRLLNGNLREEEIKQLLKLELFVPPAENGGTSALYELYWIFELLDQFDSAQYKQITLDRGQLVANWEQDGSEYLMFNDWDGLHKWDDGRGRVDYLNINWDLEEIQSSSSEELPDSFIRRQQAALSNKHQLSESVFDYNYGRKTPDIVLLKLDAEADDQQLEGIFIGEVKLSVDGSYLKKGLEQLLEYGAHAKLGSDLSWADGRFGNHIAENPDILSSTDFELGYFVGNSNVLSGSPPSGIQICGFGDTPKRPLSNK